IGHERSTNHQVAVYDRRRGHAITLMRELVCYSGPQIDPACFAEAVVRLSGFGGDREEPAIESAQEHPLLFAVRPECGAAIDEEVRRLCAVDLWIERPQFFAGLSIERNQARERS